MFKLKCHSVYIYRLRLFNLKGNSSKDPHGTQIIITRYFVYKQINSHWWQKTNAHKRQITR
jgi:hypothetical protein